MVQWFSGQRHLISTYSLFKTYTCKLIHSHYAYSRASSVVLTLLYTRDSLCTCNLLSLEILTQAAKIHCVHATFCHWRYLPRLYIHTMHTQELAQLSCLILQGFTYNMKPFVKNDIWRYLHTQARLTQGSPNLLSVHMQCVTFSYTRISTWKGLDKTILHYVGRQKPVCEQYIIITTRIPFMYTLTYSLQAALFFDDYLDFSPKQSKKERKKAPVVLLCIPLPPISHNKLFCSLKSSILALFVADYTNCGQIKTVATPLWFSGLISDQNFKFLG